MPNYKRMLNQAEALCDYLLCHTIYSSYTKVVHDDDVQDEEGSSERIYVSIPPNVQVQIDDSCRFVLSLNNSARGRLPETVYFMPVANVHQVVALLDSLDFHKSNL